MRSHSSVVGLRTSTCLLGGHILAPNSHFEEGHQLVTQLSQYCYPQGLQLSAGFSQWEALAATGGWESGVRGFILVPSHGVNSVGCLCCRPISARQPSPTGPLYGFWEQFSLQIFRLLGWGVGIDSPPVSYCSLVVYLNPINTFANGSLLTTPP